MKKLVLATLLAGLSTLAAADVSGLNTSGLYVQGDVLHSKLKATPEDGFRPASAELSFSDNAFGVRVAVGKDEGNIRYQGDYTYLGQAKVDMGGRATFKMSGNSVGFSVLYDFPTTSKLQPYAGVRASANRMKIDLVDPERTVSKSDTNAGLGAVAGVQYEIAPNILLDGGVEYNHLGKLKLVDWSEVKMNQYGAKVGVRYNF